MDWLYYLIPGLISVAALVYISVVYLRKLPQISSLDLEAMPEHRQAERKSRLVSSRLTRKLATGHQNLRAFFGPIAKVVKAIFGGIYQYLQALEERYRAAAKPMTDPETAAAAQASVATLLQEAQVLYDDTKYSEAEKKYIAAITLDMRSVDAYQGLAKVYEALNDLSHAIATLQFLEQLDPKDETIYRKLGELYQREQKYEEAMEALEQALLLGPNNPKNLDAFIDIAILNKLKYKAQSTLDKLKSVNPDNQKLEKYQEQIDQL